MHLVANEQSIRLNCLTRKSKSIFIVFIYLDRARPCTGRLGLLRLLHGLTAGLLARSGSVARLRSICRRPSGGNPTRRLFFLGHYQVALHLADPCRGRDQNNDWCPRPSSRRGDTHFLRTNDAATTYHILRRRPPLFPVEL